jgi:chorismate mutase
MELNPENISQIQSLRFEIAKINNNILTLILERKNILNLMIKNKENETSNNFYPFYDCEREWDVFKEHHLLLRQMSLKEALAFSLVMEEQISTEDKNLYPQWSEKIHLNKTHLNLIPEMINPLLLYHVDPIAYFQLHLAPWVKTSFAALPIL